MNNSLKDVSIVFLLLLVVSLLVSSTQYSLGKEKIANLINTSSLQDPDSSVNESSADELSNEQSGARLTTQPPSNKSNESSISSPTADRTNKLLSPHSEATPNLTSTTVNGQNQSDEETIKPSLATKHPFNLQKLSQTLGGLNTETPSKKLSPLGPLRPLAESTYEIKVNFDYITVRNSHEGMFSGDAEYDLAVYVQGKKISLTDAGGSGGGLWDVSYGETVKFPQGTQLTVHIPKTLPLSILTVGSEVDGCDRTAFPEDIQYIINQILTIKGFLRNVADDINDGINWIGCKLNPNDILGVINKVYEPTAYGEGSHIEGSDSADFTLKYTITVTPPPPPVSNQLLDNLEAQQLQTSPSPSNESSPPKHLTPLGILNLTSTNNKSSNVGKEPISPLSEAQPNLSSGLLNQQPVTPQSEETSKPSLTEIRPLKSLSFAKDIETSGILPEAADSNDTSKGSFNATSANETGQTYDPATMKKHPLLSGSQDLAPELRPAVYKVKVIFRSMQVVNNHEGPFSGDGEYDIAAYVQGIRVGLTDASGPGEGLWDVARGETVTFDPGSEVDLQVPYRTLISVFTVGSEVDGCGRTAFPEDIPEVIEAVKPKPRDGILPGIDPIRTIGAIQHKINSAINWIGCKLDANDIVGSLNIVTTPELAAQNGEGGEHYARYVKSTDEELSYDFVLKFDIIATKLEGKGGSNDDMVVAK